MELNSFKSELQSISTDPWGDAMEAWFECAGRLHERNEDIPNEWEYKPAKVADHKDVCEPESYWHELFENASADQLIEIGNYLANFCQLLQMAGKSY